MKPSHAIAAALLPLAALATPARAEEAQGAWSIEPSIALVSDYRFRGLSLSDKDPAIQPALSITHESGIYASFWGSTLAENDGADIETDLGLGYARTIGPVDVDLAATWYLYPGAHGQDYVEIIAKVSTQAGPATLGLELAYAPSQAGTDHASNRYAAIDAELPLGKSPLTATASLGIEDGAFGDRKLDWSLGLGAEVSGFDLAASYVDATHHGHDPLAAPGAVFSISKRF